MEAVEVDRGRMIDALIIGEVTLDHVHHATVVKTIQTMIDNRGVTMIVAIVAQIIMEAVFLDSLIVN